MATSKFCFSDVAKRAQNTFFLLVARYILVPCSNTFNKFYEKQLFTPPRFSKAHLLKALFACLLAFSFLFWGCDKADEDSVPGGNTALSAAQTQAAKAGSDKDEKYKTDKTGQYVSKDVQVTGYEDGSERPTRPKFDAADEVSANSVAPDDPGAGGGGITTPAPSPTSTFVSSVGKAGSGNIYNLEFIKDGNPLPDPETGYTRLDADLNRGAGGKYIYLSFTRNGANVSQFHPDYLDRFRPVTDIRAFAYTTGLSEWVEPAEGRSYIYEFTGNWATPSALFDYKIIDLNDGAGGKYIYGYLSKDSGIGSPIKEVGILYGNSSSISPPSGWVKVGQDLNQGAGGDYIYFCYKR